MKRRHLLLSLAVLLTAPLPAVGQTCTREQLTAVIDESDEALRKLNQEATPKLAVRIRQLKAKKGWVDDDFEAKAYEYLEDDRVRALDDQAKALLSRIDELGDDKSGPEPSCARIGDLQATFSEMKATVQAKNAYLLAKLDKELTTGETVTAAAAPPAPLSPPPIAAPTLPPLRPTLPESASAAPPPAPPPPAKPADAKANPAAPGPWVVQTKPTLPAPPPAPPPGQVVPQATSATLPPPPPLPPQQAGAPDATFTIEEIRAAGSGFFGTASAELAAVLNYAFQKAGRPNGYILGDEGGGAFIAGLRFGKGTLHTKSGAQQKVFWRGPSIGYDFGAEGARTMYLVYKLNNPEDLFATFTGIDGSAYLVGGVGITFLTKGDIVLAPIRTGLGLRLGANIGYLKFTPKQSWSPF